MTPSYTHVINIHNMNIHVQKLQMTQRGNKFQQNDKLPYITVNEPTGNN